jgi:hypothetical protein
MPSLAKLRLLLSAVTLCVASSWPGLARAEEEFPGALAEAADMACVPTCLMCHSVNPGTAGSWVNKPLGVALGGPVLAGKADGADAVDAFNAAWQKYAANPDNAASVAQIKLGREPGAGQDVCGPKYGCGASFARATPKGSLSSALAATCFVLIASAWAARRRLRGGRDNAA